MTKINHLYSIIGQLENQLCRQKRVAVVTAMWAKHRSQLQRRRVMHQGVI